MKNMESLQNTDIRYFYLLSSDDTASGEKKLQCFSDEISRQKSEANLW